jgi:hypothetical protein
MKTTLMLALVLFAGAVCGAESKYILTTKRLSSTEVGLSCSNGADPTGRKIGNTVIISCGK